MLSAYYYHLLEVVDILTHACVITSMGYWYCILMHASRVLIHYIMG